MDGVRSAQEAVTLETLGADLIGVALSPNPRSPGTPVLTEEQAATIADALIHAVLVTSMELTDRNQVLRSVAATGAGLVQTITASIPPPDVRAALREAGVGIVYSGLEINHDDDPGWVFGAFTDVPDLNAALFQVEVLPEYTGSWAFLRDESPEFAAEFQIADLDALGRERPLVVGLDFTTGNVREIIAALPWVRGIALTRGDAVRVLGAVGG
ncbi:hypothetical protein AFR_28335 [Actinoplanes friuliensis DSM 7358]|uniref:Uncharacterized protein n=1 Tax=Actinoplanes friuliensis DSM 7358 TaxID=1246995 RepID=U5W3Y6_9ACTN|nr:hypothetical protein AFR_28335 [Actinoplanes friuliensis DSM 7358]